MTVIASSSISGAAKKRYARVLSIAGSDSGGGAGIQADLKTCAALGCYGMTAITAITVQNTLGVTGIHGIPLDTVRGQIDAVVQDIGVDAVKIGMLATPDVVSVVADAIRRHGIRNVVLDPVMVATSGDRLIVPETAQALVQELFPLATVITPNLDEAALLLGRSIDGIAALDAAVADLLAMGAPAVLLKGGHLSGDLVMDVLGRQGRQAGDYLRLQSQRIVTHNGHGTGCTLSSAIASFLAQGLALEAAVTEARSYILGAIEAGAEVYTGQGHGPLNHGYAPRAQMIVEG
ncbi:UNVERIFIED_CONTAM: bifunctional hydroxymethylpyrimidine kinase/phosphomethylpyrimidine kinase [Comamonas sp. A-3]|uniref:bifunctional hydroxymethylpyrimidine kinase/phosphomethylpyrimidine kinase n=1 Tax=Comamonas TaxID=283 RepID=UPI0001BB16BF|nr:MULTISPECIES: bifunctional hydroxymethylpyrimidine kinase/phosphomethylpyrimidine kinase [Comamonas]ACY33721.1 phosphomethylpyrimidine kinase [Comamonas thiooxydans]MDO1474057.1 bifunctional hydroxymethylpyrimidine kinase/phosphomethylpyrimidine kinase [Comamonas thiooxydans]QOQ80693.1 bifunctional hydroxymethylpyrimidine kinase/phosphomethylpyrimidine kinase [Comamonas thiooxydans]UUE95698.1 bifunctional hydroxymethylpyrimidine kinase/phosphomethylpyrimidine kinase [Comamonas thiooxydans]B